MTPHPNTPEEARDKFCPLSTDAEGHFYHCQGERCMAWRFTGARRLGPERACNACNGTGLKVGPGGLAGESQPCPECEGDGQHFPTVRVGGCGMV